MVSSDFENLQEARLKCHDISLAPKSKRRALPTHRNGAPFNMKHLLPCLLLTLFASANAFSMIWRPALGLEKSGTKSSLRVDSENSSAASSHSTALVKSSGRSIDSPENYERDVTTVLKDIHIEEEDTTIPAVYRSRRLSFTNVWGLEEWRLHTSRWRYVQSVNPFQVSRLMRRIFPQLSIIVMWTAVVVPLGRRSPFLSKISIPFSYLSLISGFVAALQTLRSNDSLRRLGEGRVALGNAILLTRDSAQLFARYIYPKDQDLGLMAARHLSLFCWLLKAHLRDRPEDDVLKTMLPCPSDRQYIASQRKKPVALLVRLGQIISMAEQRKLISTAEQVRLEDNLKGLEHVIMTTERLRQAPIPPVYSSNAAGLMLLYLLFLPLVYIETNLPSIVTMFMTTSIGFAMLGLDEVSHMMEQPFRLSPLYQLSKISMLDVSDAFMCLPPPLSKRNEAPMVTKRPTYWDDGDQDDSDAIENKS